MSGLQEECRVRRQDVERRRLRELPSDRAERDPESDQEVEGAAQVLRPDCQLQKARDRAERQVLQTGGRQGLRGLPVLTSFQTKAGDIRWSGRATCAIAALLC